ncbi:small delta antigen-like protein [Thurisazvirus desmodi]|uniref:Small delta antigen-like protein n=1 Tax=Bat deltavirus TaxID=2767006 RepID=A0A7G8PYJ0_9VIRU|nr:small delta antigen-like protein [Bat deltavirus]
METPGKKKPPKPRQETLEEWCELGKRKRELEKELQRITRKRKRLEEENPWLGNVLGITRQKSGGSETPSGKKKRREEEMEVDGAPGSGAAPRTPFTKKEREDHRRRCALENKKKQLEQQGKKLSEEDEAERRRLAEEDERRKRRLEERGDGDVNPPEGPPRGAPGGGFVPGLQGVPESPYSRTGEGLSKRGEGYFP